MTAGIDYTCSRLVGYIDADLQTTPEDFNSLLEYTDDYELVMGIRVGRKDSLVKNMGILDFATGSPRETLQQTFTNHLIDDDTWMQMLKTRNQLAHDYDGSFASEKFRDIINVYYPLFLHFQKVAETYLQTSQSS